MHTRRNVGRRWRMELRKQRGGAVSLPGIKHEGVKSIHSHGQLEQSQWAQQLGWPRLGQACILSLEMVASPICYASLKS